MSCLSWKGVFRDFGIARTTLCIDLDMNYGRYRDKEWSNCQQINTILVSLIMANTKQTWNWQQSRLETADKAAPFPLKIDTFWDLIPSKISVFLVMPILKRPGVGNVSIWGFHNEILTTQQVLFIEKYICFMLKLSYQILGYKPTSIPPNSAAITIPEVWKMCHYWSYLLRGFKWWTWFKKHQWDPTIYSIAQSFFRFISL